VFPPELWQFFGIVLVPLIGLVVGSIVYWLRKLDDRQYHALANSVSKTDLEEALRPIHERLIRIENGLQNRTGDSTSSPSRWRTL
jgi:MFS superfamily sulfate permease-like transporter